MVKFNRYFSLPKAFVSDSCHILVRSLERDIYLFVHLSGNTYLAKEFNVFIVEYTLEMDVNFDF